MKTVLVFPPQGHFTQPYLSLPSLAAYLRAHGREVWQLDENIEAYDRFLTRERLERSLERVRAGEHLDKLDARPELRFSELERYQTLSEIALIGSEVAASIEDAKRVLRDRHEFYDYERYLRAARTVEQGLRLFSAEFWPTRLTAHGFTMRHRVERSREILAALDDERENPFLAHFREHTLPRIQAIDPDLVGISVTFPSQAIPSLALARLLKRWKPELHITLGGGLLAYVAEKLVKRPEIWQLIDSIVLLEGERPLLQLCEVVEGERELAQVTNLLYRDPRTGEIVKTPEAPPLDIQTLPRPDFDDLPLEKYFSPELVLPLAATRGCYWGKCVFCTLYTVIGPGYRGRTVEQTVEDIRSLQQRYGANSFYLAIEDLPPHMARRLPRAILEAGLRIHWWCDARLEHEVFDEQVCRELAASGCKRIAFGYESASDRVLKAMCKGIDPDKSLELIRRTHEAGISVTLYVMIGFPTETRAEARATLQTILENRRFVQEVSVRVFYLDETSEIFRRRSEFGIAEIFPDPEADLQVYYDFRTSSGMSRAEARAAYLEFTRELRSHFPVFQNTNMLYHELKSHYFLYLVKHGSWEALRANVLEPATEGARLPAGPPCRSARLRELELAYDRSEVDRLAAATDSATVRPRYQSDLFEEQDLARFDRELAPLRPSPSKLVYNPATGEVQCLSPAAAEVLERCDGSRTLAEVVAVFPETVRADAARCVEAIARAGLLESRSPEPVR